MVADPVKMPRPVLRALQVAGTAAVFSLASELASLFSQPDGASFLFPPAGVSLAAGAAFGVTPPSCRPCSPPPPSSELTQSAN